MRRLPQVLVNSKTQGVQSAYYQEQARACLNERQLLIIGTHARLEVNVCLMRLLDDVHRECVVLALVVIAKAVGRLAVGDLHHVLGVECEKVACGDCMARSLHLAPTMWLEPVL